MQHPLFPTASLFVGLVLISTCFLKSSALDCKPLAKTVTVDQSGGGDTKTVQAAIDSIPANNDQWIKIHVRAGVYKEKVTTSPEKQCIFLEGEGREKTVISWNDHASMSSSPTFTVRSDNFVAKAISFENSYNLEEFAAQRIFMPKTFNQIDVVGGPVPALAVQIGGDKHAYYQCGFLGYQDTILDLEGRHYFSECYIEGAVDFIFGGGQSFYEKCDINITGYGYITAQGRDEPDKQDGFVFESCNVFGTGPTYLGRAYGPYSRVIYHSCTFDVNVEAPGWDAWTYTGHEGNFTYVESDCKGAHYDTSKRVTWLKNLETDQLSAFTRDTFINQEGWIQKIPT